MRAAKSALFLMLALALTAGNCRAAAPVPEGAQHGMVVHLYGAIDPRLPTGSVAGY